MQAAKNGSLVLPLDYCEIVTVSCDYRICPKFTPHYQGYDQINHLKMDYGW